MKKVSKSVSGLLLGTLLVSQMLSPIGVFAKEEKEKEVKKVTKSKSFSKAIEKKRSELLNLDKDIIELEQELKGLNKALEQEKVLKEKEKEVQEKEAFLKERWEGYTDKIAAWQLEGTPEENFLDVLFGSESLSDMISRAYTFKTLMTAEQEQIKVLKEETENLILEKNNLAKDIQELKEKKDESLKKEKELAKKRSTMKKELQKLEKNEKERIEKELKEQARLKQLMLEKQVKLEKLKELRALTKKIKEQEEQERKLEAEKTLKDMKDLKDMKKIDSDGALLRELSDVDISTEIGYQFISPAEGRFTSPYGVRPNPFGGSGTEFHTGIDLANVSGTPILATAGGEVIQVVSSNAGYGNYILLKHEIEGKTFHSLYAHLSLSGVQVGEKVEQGEIIGLMGTTGRSTGSHLHFEIQDGNRKHMNPMSFLDKKKETSSDDKDEKEKKDTKRK